MFTTIDVITLSLGIDADRTYRTEFLRIDEQDRTVHSFSSLEKANDFYDKVRGSVLSVGYPWAQEDGTSTVTTWTHW